MELQHLTPVLDCSFQAYGFTWFLGLAFRNHSGHITIVEQASIIQPMWRKGIGKEVIFKAQTEAHQSSYAGECPAWKALISLFHRNRSLVEIYCCDAWDIAGPAVPC